VECVREVRLITERVEGPGPTSSLFSFIGHDTGLVKLYNHPPFRRAYWRALRDAAVGPMTAGRVAAAIDARNRALTANRVSVASTTALKSYLAARRDYILTQLATVTAPLAVTSNGGANFSSDTSTVTLTGTAPVEVKTLLFNGSPFPVSFTSVTAWRTTVPLKAGANRVEIQGLDSNGTLLPGLRTELTITYTGALERPEDHLVINEILYRPSQTNAAFVEVFNNASATAFDLTGVRMEGVDFDFPDGLILGPQAYAVIVDDALAFRAAFGAVPVVGTFNGKLDRGGETLRLIRKAAAGAPEIEYDRVRFDDDLPWPQAAATNGASLQRIDPSLPGNRLANWSDSMSSGSVTTTVTNVTTVSLVGYGSTWKFHQGGTDLGSAWRGNTFADSSWTAGAGLHYVEDAALPAAKGTSLTIGRMTYYFRHAFQFSGNPADAVLKLSAIVDDGAVFYLNGEEVFRVGMPEGAVNYGTMANRTVTDAVVEGPFDIPGRFLRSGENVLAVEVHQVGAGSTDVAFGAQLSAVVTTVTTTTMTGGVGAAATPGAANSVKARLDPFPDLWINEVLPRNTLGIRDRTGSLEPWVEVFNASPSTVSAKGLFLSDSARDLVQWPFPEDVQLGGRQFRVIFADGTPGERSGAELHTAFRLAPTQGMVLLTRMQNGRPAVLDYVTYGLPGSDRSVGSYPDGQEIERQVFHVPTPGGPNDPTSVLPQVRINEWMAGNTRSLADTADGDFEDWFEMHNASTEPFDLGGYFLSDVSTNAVKFEIPQGTLIPAGGFLLAWADEETGQNGTGGDLHVNFKLSLSGEAILLFAPDGRLVHSVTFGVQTNDVSQGSQTDGGSAFQFFVKPTPRASNAPGSGPPPNRPPLIAGIPGQAILAGAGVNLLATATDPDLPAQFLRFSLDAGAPPGAVIDPVSGRFSWTSSASHSGLSFPVTVRVTDNGLPPLSGTASFMIAVSSANRPPVMASGIEVSAEVGQLWRLTLAASDPDSPPQTLRYSFQSAVPPGLSLDADAGVLSWTPAAHQAGEHTIRVRATDNGQPPLFAEMSVKLRVSAAPEGLRIESLRVAPNGAVTLQWPSLAGSQYRVEIRLATGEGSWIPLQTLRGTGASLSYQDHPAPGTRQRFYRINVLP